MFDVLLAFLQLIIQYKTKYTKKVVKKQQAGGSKKLLQPQKQEIGFLSFGLRREDELTVKIVKKKQPR